MPPSWLAPQQVEVAKRIAAGDVVISTALIPGRDAPTSITEEMVKAMKPGSVIVDIAAGMGTGRRRRQHAAERGVSRFRCKK